MLTADAFGVLPPLAAPPSRLFILPSVTRPLAHRGWVREPQATSDLLGCRRSCRSPVRLRSMLRDRIAARGVRLLALKPFGAAAPTAGPRISIAPTRALVPPRLPPPIACPCGPILLRLLVPEAAGVRRRSAAAQRWRDKAPMTKRRRGARRFEAILPVLARSDEAVAPAEFTPPREPAKRGNASNSFAR